MSCFLPSLDPLLGSGYCNPTLLGGRVARPRQICARRSCDPFTDPCLDGTKEEERVLCKLTWLIVLSKSNAYTSSPAIRPRLTTKRMCFVSCRRRRARLPEAARSPAVQVLRRVRGIPDNRRLGGELGIRTGAPAGIAPPQARRRLRRIPPGTDCQGSIAPRQTVPKVVALEPSRRVLFPKTHRLAGVLLRVE